MTALRMLTLSQATGAQEPWTLGTDKRCRSGFVENHLGIGVILKEAGSDDGGHLSLDGPGDNVGFAFAKRHHDDPPRFEDGSHPHGDRPPGNMFFAEEIAGRVHPRDLVERDHAGAAVTSRPGLVEADVPGATDAQQLQVQSARIADLLLVGAAVGVHVLDRNGAVGNVGIFGRDVDVVKKMLPHEPPVALQFIRPHWQILVEVEADHVGETQPLFFVQANEFGIDAGGCRAGGKAQDAAPAAGGTLANQRGDLLRHCHIGLLCAGKDLGRDFLTDGCMLFTHGGLQRGSIHFLYKAIERISSKFREIPDFASRCRTKSGNLVPMDDISGLCQLNRVNKKSCAISGWRGPSVARNYIRERPLLPTASGRWPNRS